MARLCGWSTVKILSRRASIRRCGSCGPVTPRRCSGRADTMLLRATAVALALLFYAFAPLLTLSGVISQSERGGALEVAITWTGAAPADVGAEGYSEPPTGCARCLRRRLPPGGTRRRRHLILFAHSRDFRSWCGLEGSYIQVTSVLCPSLGRMNSRSCPCLRVCVSSSQTR